MIDWLHSLTPARKRVALALDPESDDVREILDALRDGHYSHAAHLFRVWAREAAQAIETGEPQ